MNGGDQVLLEYAKGLEVDDMPSQDLKWIAKSIGVEAAVRLTLEHAGIRIHLPRRLVFLLKRRCVQKLFNGSNIRELSGQLGVCETTVRKWTCCHQTTTKTTPEQTCLFDGQ